MSTGTEFDLLVIGGGPAGYVAALRAGQLGLKTALVEKDKLGGVCLNKGCIPSKTLLAATELKAKLEKAGEWGLELPGEPAWKLKKLFEKKEEVILKLRQGIESLVRKRKIEVLSGEAAFAGPGKVRVGAESYTAKKIILATGSSPRILDFGVKNRKLVFFSEEALTLERVPSTLLILGAGPEGCEFALIYKGLGSKVILVEQRERVLPGFDRDASAALKRALLAKGIEILTEESLVKATEVSGKIKAELKSGKRLDVDAVLVSAGRIPNSSGLGLESMGLERDGRGSVLTDENLRTNLDWLYAVGDVRGDKMMAHVSSYEGYKAAEFIAGKTGKLNYSAVPSCCYTYPEVASVGLSEEELEAKNIPCESGRFSFMALGRSHAKGQTEGFVKLLGHAKTNEVLGCVVVGESASEIINLAAFAIKNHLKMETLADHMAAHPSASEAVSEAAHLFFKEGLHVA